MYAPAPVVEDFGGWYLRGDIGFSNQRVKRLNNALDSSAPPRRSRSIGFDTAGIFGLGVGYKFNNWFRADVTGEYRGNSQFFGTDIITYRAAGVGVDTYHATKSEWVVLANAYADLGTWWCMTPFIGAGVGGARITITNFTDQGDRQQRLRRRDRPRFRRQRHRNGILPGRCMPVLPTRSRRTSRSNWPIAISIWATADRRPAAFDGTNNVVNPTQFKNITSHDLSSACAGISTARRPTRRR